MSDIRSRRAGIGPDEARQRPLYARVLGLQFLRLSSLMCFMFFEGAIALAVLLALAELVSWWAVLVLPVSVAAMVKINDVISGATTRSGGSAVPRTRRAAAPAAGPGLAAGPARAAGLAPGEAPLARSAQAADSGPAIDPAPEVGQAATPSGIGQEAVTGIGQDAVPGRLREAVPTESVSGAPTSPAHGEQRVISAEQRARQSANYRYE